MTLLHVILLAIVQGLAELLPVSSSAHVVVAERLMGLDPTSPQMTLLLVMLHTGTMFAVIAYFWKKWSQTYFKSANSFKRIAIRLIAATVLTIAIGGILVKLVEKTLFHGADKAEIEQLFGRLDLIAAALFAAGLLILYAGLKERKALKTNEKERELTMSQSAWIGAVQGLCLPFRGFSRSGATISTGMLTGVARSTAETFSFALAVIITPLAIAREALRLVHATHADPTLSLSSSMTYSLLGAVFAFFAGLVALKWLSSWLEAGRWYLFGIYCLIASVVVYYLHHLGY